MRTFTEYREGTIEFYNACTAYFNGRHIATLERIMLLAYSLSKYIRTNGKLTHSNPKLTAMYQPIDRTIARCVEFLEREDVDPLVKANLLETLSRSAYRVIKLEKKQ